MLALQPTRSILSASTPIAKMSTKAAEECMSCGSDVALKQCATCKERMGNKGRTNAVCAECFKDPIIVESFGKGSPSEPDAGFKCRPCGLFLERKEQEALFLKLKGPEPEQVLRTVAAKYPWALVIVKASPEDLLDALGFLKRKLSGHRTVQALAESLANSNTQAALLMQQFGQKLTASAPDDSTGLKVLRTFVKNQCPSIKYKSLLLPPYGSIYKTVRHFQEL